MRGAPADRLKALASRFGLGGPGQRQHVHEHKAARDAEHGGLVEHVLDDGDAVRRLTGSLRP